MRNLASFRKDARLALVATLAVVLQAFFMAWSVSAAPAAPTLDAFGNPLCIGSAGDPAAAGAAGRAGHGQADCCAFGCCLSATTPAQAPDDGLFLLVRPAAPRPAITAAPADPRLPAEHDPARPRAPPTTA